MADMRLEGRSVLLQCPTCRGPMSVRLWLMEAECWQCGTRIEISEAQRAAIELSQKKPEPPMERSVAKVRHDPPQALKEPISIPVTPVTQEIAVKLPPKIVKPKSPSVAPVDKGIPASQRELIAKPARKEVSDSHRKGAAIEAPPIQLLSVKRKSLIEQLLEAITIAPAWLVSLLVHLVLLLILAIMSTETIEDRGIVLSLNISPLRSPGDIESLFRFDERAFDLPLPKEMNPNDPNDAGLIREASALAGNLQQLNYENGFRPEPLQEIRQHLHQPYQTSSGLLSRDIRVRSEVLKANGGTLMTEAAVARALRWIAAQQKADGAWRLDSISYDPGRGEISSKPAATALALLPFLGAGQTHKSGIYREHVRKGIRYLLGLQQEDGDLRGGTEGEAGMYVHGQATIVLCEAFAMTQDPALSEPVQRAIAFIERGQHRAGGWRYQPKMPGDTSVLGWQVMALQSARMAGLEVEERTLERADRFLDTVQNSNGATYGYMPGHAPSPNMTAEAVLCRLYLGHDRQDPSIQKSLRLLMRDYPPSNRHVDYYYWYYATQAFHHVGGSQWEKWNEGLQGTLLERQVTQGKHAGSWNVEGYLADKGGRLYVTSLAACTLEVYYRHLPLFESIAEKGNSVPQR